MRNIIVRKLNSMSDRITKMSDGSKVMLVLVVALVFYRLALSGSILTILQAIVGSLTHLITVTITWFRNLIV